MKNLKKNISAQVKSSWLRVCSIWRRFGLFAFLVAGLMLVKISASGKSFQTEEPKQTTSFHTIPIGHREIVVTNFQGSLIWHERVPSNQKVVSYLQSESVPPIRSVGSKIVTQIPFQATGFSLVGSTTSGDFLPKIEFRD